MSSAVYDYIEDISDLSNNRYEYKTLKSKKALGDELIRTLDKYNCDPAKALYKATNGSKKFGFRLMSIVSDAPLRLRYKPSVKVSDGIGMIGAGAYGTVYIGCIDKACKKEVAIKMASAKENRLEYNFMKKFVGVSPNITHAYYYKQCDKPLKSVLYLEYYSFGSIKRLIGKFADKLRKLHYRVTLFQVIWTLAELHKKFPTFRHNDLHLENVFIDDRVTAKGSIRYGKFLVPNVGMNAVIGDFGFSNMQVDGFKNAKVQSGNYKYDYGIAVDSNPMYDVHFFFYSLYIVSEDDIVKSFIERHFPAKYLHHTTSVVEKSRLKYGADHSGLPTFEQILDDKMFRFFKSKGDTVIPPVNTFPRNMTRPVTKKSQAPPKVSRKSPKQTLSPPPVNTFPRNLTRPVTKKSQAPPKVSRKSPKQTLSPPPQPRKVVARPTLPSPKKASPFKFTVGNLHKYMAKPTVRAVPVVLAAPKSSVKPQVDPARLKKMPRAPKKKGVESKLEKLLRNSPQKGNKFGVSVNGNAVRFTNDSSRGKMCESFKKADIIAKAKQIGITGVDNLSKEKICAMIKNALA
jgi:serine/threonine protein kinase